VSYQPAKLAAPDVLPLARAYVALPENSVGGNLHIVLEDRNVETEHIHWCYEQALEKGDHLGSALALLLRSMSRTQRLKITHECWKVPT
jgi:hypothetical protein